MRNSRIIFAALGVLLVVSAIWMCVEYTGNRYSEEQIIASSYTHSANYDYNAPVTLSNPIYPMGKVLDAGQPAYFFSVSPTMDVFFTYTLDATDSADLTVECDTFVIATSKGNVGGEGKIFWQKKYPVVYANPVSIGDGEEVSYSFSLNIPDIQSKVKTVQDELGYSQGTNIKVVTYVNYEGKINGKKVKDVEEFSIPLTISSSFYQMPEKLDFSDTVDTYETIKVKATPSLPAMIAPIFSFISSIGLILLFGFFRKQGEVSSSYINKLEVESENAQYDDFISKGTLPVELNSLVEVGVSSLKDLVDAAVDMDARVMHDPKKGVYFIIHSGIIYRFSEDSSNGSESAE